MSPKTEHKNFRNFISNVFVLLLIILLINVILQSSLAAELKGKVVGINGENLDGAEVKIYDGTNLMYEVITTNGSYDINISEGNYFVVVTYNDKKGNLYVDSINLAIKQDEIKSIEFSFTASYTYFSHPDTSKNTSITETNLTGGLQSNKSNSTILSDHKDNSLNMPDHGDTFLNILLFIIFIFTIILVFFYILYAYYNAKKAEEKIEEFKTILMKTSNGATETSSSTTPPSAAGTTLTSPLAATNNQENASIGEKERYAKEEQHKEIIQQIVRKLKILDLLYIVAIYMLKFQL